MPPSCRANADAAIRRIDALAAEIARILEPAASRPFVVFHDAYQYFEKRLAAGAITLGPSAAERSPPPRRAPEDRSPGAGVRIRRAAVPDEAHGRGQRGHGRGGVLDPVGATLAPGPTSIRSCCATWPRLGGLPVRDSLSTGTRGRTRERGRPCHPVPTNPPLGAAAYSTAVLREVAREYWRIGRRSYLARASAARSARSSKSPPPPLATARCRSAASVTVTRAPTGTRG